MLRLNMSIHRLTIISLVFITLSFIKPNLALANPYYYVNATPEAVINKNKVFQIQMDTTGDDVDELEGVFDFSPIFWQFQSLDTSKSICRTWLKPNLDIPDKTLADKITPYYANSQIRFHCNLAKKGFNASDGLIFSVTLLPLYEGNTNMEFKNPYFSLISTAIRPGAMDNFSVIIQTQAQASAHNPLNKKANKSSFSWLRILLLILVICLYLFLIFCPKIIQYLIKHKTKFSFIAKTFSKSHNLNDK
jgi:hypothetical protein